MKNLNLTIVLASLLLLTFMANGQTRNYIPMVNVETVWFETYSFMPSPYGYNSAGKVYFHGDTTFNNKQYQKLYKIFVDVMCQEIIENVPYYSGALREDTQAQKVWIVEWDANDEILFFDFTLEVGDTVPDDCYFSREFSPIIVSNIDTTNFYGGVDRRRWSFEYEGDLGSVVIEGIGSINGLLAGYIFPMGYYWEQLFCLDELQEYPPIQSDCVLPSDTCVTVGIPEPEAKDDFLVFPNPISNSQQLHIQKSGLDSFTKNTTIKLYSLHGEMIFESNFTGNYFNFDLHNPLAGLYILQIITNNKIVTKRIIIR